VRSYPSPVFTAHLGRPRAAQHANT
jgi:hypothetical protein